MSPVRVTCVPPQSSRELPISSTRTSSPYFSPKSIIAPSFCASSIGITRALVASFARISAFTRSSTRRISSGGHRRVVAEVEARLVLVDQRALLLHVGAEHLAQRLVHEVRRRVVAHGARALVEVDLGGDRVAHAQLAGLHHAVVAEGLGLDLLRVLHLEEREARAALGELAAVAHLAAGLRVEGRLVEDDDAFLAGGEALDRGALAVERHDAALLGERVVAAEAGLRAAVLELRAGLELATPRASAPAARAIAALKAAMSMLEAALAADVGHHVDREAERVVELEGDVAGELLRIAGERAPRGSSCRFRASRRSAPPPA